MVFSGCSKKRKFERPLWGEGDGLNFQYRDNMVDDLLATHQFKGMKLKQVTDSLGRPQGFKKNIMYYDIFLKLDTIPSSYIKRLYIHFNTDSVVTRAEVYEHDAKKKKKK
ncbi:MAG: hypothetical protein ABIP28_06100 [Mucilaginibacter sp.]